MVIESVLLLIVCGFACYRLAYLVTKEYGLFDVFKKWRGFWAGLANMAQASGRFVRLTATVAELFHCPYCVGAWLALVAAALLFPDRWFLCWWAIAGIAVYLERTSK